MRVDGSHAKHISGTYFGNWMIFWYTDRLYERHANTFISITLLVGVWSPKHRLETLSGLQTTPDKLFGEFWETRLYTIQVPPYWWRV